MSDGTANNSIWLTAGCSAAVLAAVSLSYKFIEPNRGHSVKIHLIYFAIAVCSIVFIPVDIASYIFTELTVTLGKCMYYTAII